MSAWPRRHKQADHTGCRRPPELMDELVEEILLRLPPDKLARLVRAALVCKRWCRVVMDPGFRRRFRQFHGTPPMLGFIIGRQSDDTRFLPCSSFHPSDDDCRSWCPLDARHGCVLFYNGPDWTTTSRTKVGVFMVWTPVTSEVRTLRMPRFLSSHWNAALLCVAPGCDHMECPSGGPFNVVLVGRTRLESSFHAYVYLSEADEWSETASIFQRGYLQHCTCNVLVGNALYFLQYQNIGILEYDLVKKELSVVGVPPILCDGSNIIVLMSLEDGGRLGFAMVDGFSLSIWVRESAPTKSSGLMWTLHKVVDLKGFPALSKLTPSSFHIIAAADAVGVFLIWAKGAGVVAIDVKSHRVRRVFRYNFVNVIPYMSFCTLALRAATNNEGPCIGASNNA